MSVMDKLVFGIGLFGSIILLYDASKNNNAILIIFWTISSVFFTMKLLRFMLSC